jgi:RHS repeat-associated protein
MISITTLTASSTTELIFCAFTYQFTGKERDAESGLDYFGARYYASSMGRFSSPDPSGLYLADPTNPQSLNLYNYVLNNPLASIDPDGLECVWSDGSYDSNDDKDTGDNAGTNGDHGGCRGQGGAWVDHSFFANQGAADWSSSGNADLAGTYTAITSNSTTVNVNADGSGSVNTTNYGYQSNWGVYFTKQDTTQSAPPIQQIADGVMAFGIPTVCGIGVSASLGKLSGGASVSNNSAGGNVDGHSAGTETPKAEGSGHTPPIPIGGPAGGFVPFTVYYNSSGNLTAVDAGLSVKTRFGKVGLTPYINLGTYSANMSPSCFH